MLTLALALMAWSPATIGIALADEGEGAKPSADTDSAVADGRGTAASQLEKAEDGNGGTSSDTEDSSDEKPAPSDPSASDGDGEDSGDDSDTGADTPEGTGEGDDDASSPNGEGAGQSDDDASTPVSGDDGNGKSESAPDGTPPDDGAQSGGGDNATPAASAEGKPQGNDPQAGDTTPKGSSQVPAGMVKVHPGITATAKVLSKPANGKAYVAGETIEFRFVVRNTGDVPLYNVRMSNLISGAVSAPVVAKGAGYTASGAVASIALLNPGKQVSIPVSYKVLAADAGASISDTATVKAVNPADPQKPISTSASTNSVKVTSISSPTAAPKAVAPPAPTTPIAGVGEPVAKIENEAKPLPTVEPQRKTPPEKKGDTSADGKDSWQLSDLLPIVVVGALCLAVLIAAFIHKRREAAQDVAS